MATHLCLGQREFSTIIGIRQIEFFVELAQIGRDVRRIVGIDNRDGLSRAISANQLMVAIGEKYLPDVVGMAHLRRRQTLHRR